MKAVRIHEFGGPDQVHVEDVPLPKVARGKALVRIRAAGVNPVDWMVREHIYNPKGADRVPLTLGRRPPILLPPTRHNPGVGIIPVMPRSA